MMITIAILFQLGLLYALALVRRPSPISFRLFLGLIITWPLLGLYFWIELPAGLPDIHFHRFFVFFLLVTAGLSAYLVQGLRRSHAGFGVLHRPLSGPASKVDLSNSLMRPTLSSGSSRPMFSARNRDETPHSTIPLVMYGFVFSMALSILHGRFIHGNSLAISSFIDATLIPLGMFYFTRRFVNSRQSLGWMLAAIVAASLLASFSGFYERVLDLTDSPFPITPHNEAGDTRYLGVPGGRAAGVLINPGVFGAVMGMGMMTCLVFLRHSQKTLTTWMLRGIMLVLGYAVLVSFTRSAWVSVGFVFLLGQCLIFKNRWKVVLAFSLLGLCLVPFFLGSILSNDLVQERVLEKENVTGRLDRSLFSFACFLEQPIFGRGPGSLDNLIKKEFPGDGFSSSHNTFMTMLVDSGLLTFAFFSGILFRWFSKTYAVIRSKRVDAFEYSATIAMAGILLIWLLTGLTLELSHFPYFVSLLWIAGAIIEQIAAGYGRTQVSADFSAQA